MFNEIIKKTITAAQPSAAFVKGDYYKEYFDNCEWSKVIVCGKCGKVKETYPHIPRPDGVIFPFGEPVKVACLCDCQTSEQKRREREEQHRKKIERLRRECWGEFSQSGEFVYNNNFEKINTFDNSKIGQKCAAYVGDLQSRLEDYKKTLLFVSEDDNKNKNVISSLNFGIEKEYSAKYIDFWILSHFDFNNFADKQKIEELRNADILGILNFNFSIPDVVFDFFKNFIKFRNINKITFITADEIPKEKNNKLLLFLKQQCYIIKE